MRSNILSSKASHGVTGINKDGREVFKYKYVFAKDGGSKCGQYMMTDFFQEIIKVNPGKVMMKIIASRVCYTIGKNNINLDYSSWLMLFECSCFLV